MGCDIHLYKEKLVEGRWTEADEWTENEYYARAIAAGEEDTNEPRLVVDWKKRFTARNYALFGFLSDGVRESHPFSFAPRGFPGDASPLVKACYEMWGVDAHSASHLTVAQLREAMETTVRTKTIRVAGLMEVQQFSQLKRAIAAGEPNAYAKHLFPYCEWTNQVGYAPFDIQVPASFYFGENVRQILESFDEVPGTDEEKRIVFWFDN